MLLKLDSPKLFSDVVGIISELVTEARIKVNKDGLSIIAIDPANVALISFKLPASSFSAIEANNEVLGVSLDSLKSVLKRCSPGSNLIMQTEDNNTLRVEIHDKIKRVFNLALINIDQEEKTMPSLEFNCKIEMPSIDFLEAVEDCSVVADSCSFSILDGKFIIDGKGLHSTKSEFSGDEAKIQGEKGKAKYSLEYMQKFVKACKLSEKTGINFSDDYPLKLEFKNPELELAFVLAPRVETED
jgi:proliferating cell nuclear antigen